MTEPTSNEYLTGNFAPIVTEAVAYDLPVVGEIPSALSGSLYRVGPNPQFPPRDSYHWFAGDGMVHAFHVDNGRVGYTNKWVHTPKWELENRAGRALFGSFGNPLTSDASVIGSDSGLANTNVVWFGGRLMALEEGHQPFMLHPQTLEAGGYLDFNGTGSGKFTAHPKVDPVTGEMSFFAYSAGGMFTSEIDYGVLDASGVLTRYERFAAPFCSMMHDFVTTENYVIFPVMPLTGKLERAMRGQFPWVWEPDASTHVGILRRGDPASAIRWFIGDPTYVFHFMNAREEGDRILVDGMAYPEAPLFPRADGSATTQTTSRLTRWTFDLAADSDTFRSAPVGEAITGDFPRIDERRAGLRNRHGFLASRTEDVAPQVLNVLNHIDHESGAHVRYELPRGDLMSEAVFVPRSAEAAEGDGWLIAVIYRGAEHRSDLAVFDTADITAGPVGCAQLSSRVPFGFHGNWRAN